MNCTNLNTAAEILEAFRACKNPGEEIELFECLATRPDPPVGAFLDILRSIKLEAVLALTIQAFGKITVANIKADLKESKDLLTMLSQQAQSGSSDLIKWSAATAIEEIGFNFLMVAQYLTQDPKNIIDDILESNSISSSSDPNQIRFWSYGPLEKPKKEAQKWKFSHSLTGNIDRFYIRLAISGDGQTLFSGNIDGIIKIWQVSTGKELYTITTGHRKEVIALAISGDGQTLFSGSVDGIIKIWQVSTGKELRTFTGYPNYPVSSLAISRDGQTLFSASCDGAIKIWQVSTGKVLYTLTTGYSKDVWALAISRDGQTLFSGSVDGVIKIWQVSTGKELRTFTGYPNHPVFSLAISGDGQTLFSASRDGAIKIWQVSTGQQLRTLTGHSECVYALAISGNEQTLFSGSIVENAKDKDLWQVNTWKLHINS